MRKTVTINSKEFLTPTFIGVGGQKCASTWLSECLRRHPEIFMSSPKELLFFGGKRWETKGIEWYLGYFQASGQYKVAGEISPGYLVKPFVPERIKSTIGQVKIIISIRNPIHRFISHYKMCIRIGIFPKEGFSSLNPKTFREATKLVPELLINGHYYDGIKNHIDAFGRENVHIMVKEDIDKNPESEVRNLYKFLEVDQNYIPSIIDKKVNESTIPRYDTLNNLRLKVAKIAKRRSPWVINHLRKFRIDETFKQLNSVKKQLDFTVEDRVLNELNLYYRAEVANVQNFLGGELEQWDFSPNQVEVINT